MIYIEKFICRCRFLDIESNCIRIETIDSSNLYNEIAIFLSEKNMFFFLT